MPKSSRKRETPRERDRYAPLTVARTRRLAERLMWQGTEEEIGDFLMLCRALTYSEHRETLYIAVEFGIGSFLPRVCRTIDDMIGERLEALEEGGAP